MTGEEFLDQVAEALREGRPAPNPTVREFLARFGVQRRGSWIVWMINTHLSDRGLVTVPDFEAAYIDALLEFQLVEKIEQPAEATSAPGPGDSTASSPEQPAGLKALMYADPAYRISKLEAANRAPIRIAPDANLSEAVTLMLSNGFSQLPVMSNDRDVKGVISWSSIGSRLGIGRTGEKVRELMDQHHEIRADSSIFSAISIIVDHDYVLVRAPDNKITGIVTASDLSLQFRGLSEPFLLLSEIENHVRGIIFEKFELEDLSAAKDPTDTEREIQGVADLTFGEYVRLLENKDQWTKLGIGIDRAAFCKTLNEIRRIRNDVMHFDPDGITDEDLEKLRDFSKFLNRLQVLIK